MAPLELLAVLAGCGLLLVVAWDVVVTILHPAARGPLSAVVDRGVWRALHTVPAPRAGRRLVSFAGPAAVLLTLGVWLTGTALGYALVFLPFVDEFVSASGEPTGAGGVGEALYLSGTSLSTVGFGDVVATRTWLRLVTVLESVSGLVLITAGITYLLSITPYLLGLRGSSSRLAELGALDPEGATRLALHGGSGAVERVHEDLVRVHEEVRRFPVLFLFEPRDPEASVLTLLRAATSMCLVLRWGVRPGALPFAELYGQALTTTLRRVREDYEQELPRLVAREAHPRGDDPGPDERLRRLRAVVAAAAPGLEAPPGSAPPELREFLADADAFLGALARAYRYDAPELL